MARHRAKIADWEDPAEASGPWGGPPAPVLRSERGPRPASRSPLCANSVKGRRRAGRRAGARERARQGAEGGGEESRGRDKARVKGRRPKRIENEFLPPTRESILVLTILIL